MKKLSRPRALYLLTKIPKFYDYLEMDLGITALTADQFIEIVNLAKDGNLCAEILEEVEKVFGPYVGGNSQACLIFMMDRLLRLSLAELSLVSMLARASS